jgi:uncharacterized protein YjbJ (UPF0337 family)
VRLIVGIIVLIIVAGIVLVLLKANPTNSIVSDVHDAARWFAGPFDGIFSFHSARVALAVNWGTRPEPWIFHPNQGAPVTNKNIDKAKGRVKEAAGAATGDRHLKNKGRVDQAKGSAKNVVDKVGDTLTGRNKK